MDHLSGPVASWWKNLGSFTDWPAGSKQSIVDGVAQEAGGRTVDELARMRDVVLLEIVKLRMKQAESSAPAHAR